MKPRKTPAEMMELHSRHIVLYDGVCKLCDKTVQFILPRDPGGDLHFAPFQGQIAHTLMAHHGIKEQSPPSGLLFFDKGQVFHESSAMLRIFAYLRFPWKFLAVFLVIPRPLRDAVYRFIARNRYRWFGKEEACLLPNPKWRDRFID